MFIKCSDGYYVINVVIIVINVVIIVINVVLCTDLDSVK